MVIGLGDGVAAGDAAVAATSIFAACSCAMLPHHLVAVVTVKKVWASPSSVHHQVGPAAAEASMRSDCMNDTGAGSLKRTSSMCCLRQQTAPQAATGRAEAHSATETAAGAASHHSQPPAGEAGSPRCRAEVQPMLQAQLK